MEHIEINTLKDNIDRIISPKLIKLTGFIFNYDKCSNENISLFNDFLEISSNDFLCGDTFSLSAQVRLGDKKDEFQSLKQRINDYGSDELGDAFNYYVENFEKIEIFFELLALYIPIEAEKIFKFQNDGDELYWFDGNKQSHINEIERLEEQIFGKKISSSPVFSKKTLDYMKEKYQENSGQLSSEEDDFLQECLSKIYTVASVSKDVENEGIVFEEAINFDDPLSLIEGLDEKILEKEISRDQYVEVFQLAIDILGLEGVEVLVKDNISNISVSPRSINIPSNSNYAFLTVRRIIGLISHELERHAVGNANNQQLIGNLKSLSYLGQEEGVAHIMEHLALGYNLDSIPMNRYMPRMLAGEVLGGQDFKKFLYIMNKLDGQDIDIEAFFLRFKRGKDLDLPGVNPKEKLYGQGALECIERLRNCENPIGMFLAKNGSSEQGEINEMITGDKNGTVTPEIIHDKKLILPLMLGELLRFQILNPESTDKGMLGGFIKYFQDRYGTLFDSLGFSYKDFIKNHIGVQNKQNRERVNQILGILQS